MTCKSQPRNAVSYPPIRRIIDEIYQITYVIKYCGSMNKIQTKNYVINVISFRETVLQMVLEELKSWRHEVKYNVQLKVFQYISIIKHLFIFCYDIPRSFPHFLNQIRRIFHHFPLPTPLAQINIIIRYSNRFISNYRPYLQ